MTLCAAPCWALQEGDGKLRRLTSEPITAVQGDDLITFLGKGYVAEAVRPADNARELNFIGEFGPARP
jgi:hypothetical protein